MIAFLCIALLASNVAAWPSAHQQTNEFEPADGPSILSSLPKELQDQIPEHVKQETKFLTAKDVLVLKNVIEQLPKFTSLMEIRNTLKKHSPRLESIAEKKAFKVMAVVAKKRTQLLPETKNAFHEARKMSVDYSQSIINLVKSLSPEVKNNLDTTFPHASYVLNSPLAHKIIDHIQSQH